MFYKAGHYTCLNDNLMFVTTCNANRNGTKNEQ